MRRSAAIVDLDGTVADIDHRLHHINKTPKDWENFNQASSADNPKQDIIDIVNALNDFGYAIIIVTGRDQKIRDKTTAWLRMNDVPFETLFMRSSNDFRSDHVVKQEIYEKHIKEHYEVHCVLEDRDQVVDMWRSLGLTCLQVQKGDY